jgi:hypothetical protein
MLCSLSSNRYDGDSVVMLNLTDADPTVLNNETNAASLEINSLTEEWVARASDGMTTMLTYLDNLCVLCPSPHPPHPHPPHTHTHTHTHTHIQHAPAARKHPSFCSPLCSFSA